MTNCNLKLYFAPMEGITYPQYRYVHSKMFGGADCYYSPFIPTGVYDRKFLSKHFPDILSGIPLVPQIIANDADKFNITVHSIKDYGYDEVNLNAGCPSSTVYSKFKGSGMLRDLNSLNLFLEKAFDNPSAKISIKTRMGVSSVTEFNDILPIYNKFDISLLTIHARDREGMYKSSVDKAMFISALSTSKNTVCYNGDIFSPDDYASVVSEMPELSHIMIGRGAIANPALFRMIRGGAPLSRNELSAFHDELIEEYLKSGLSPNFTAERVKTLWAYMSCLFSDCDKELKNIRKSHGLDNFKSAVHSLISSCDFDGSSSYVAMF